MKRQGQCLRILLLVLSLGLLPLAAETNLFKVAKVQFPNSVTIPLAIEWIRTLPSTQKVPVIRRNLFQPGRIHLQSMSNTAIGFFSSTEPSTVQQKNRKGDVFEHLYTTVFFNLPPDTYYLDEIEGYYMSWQKDKENEAFKQNGWSDYDATSVTFTKTTAISFTIGSNEHLNIPATYIAMNEMFQTLPFVPVFKIEGDGTLKSWSSFDEDIGKWNERLILELAPRIEKTPWQKILSNLPALWVPN